MRHIFFDVHINDLTDKQKGDSMMRKMGMKTLKEICRNDSKYVETIKGTSIVKNAVILLGGKMECGGEVKAQHNEEGRNSDSWRCQLLAS